MNKIYQPIFSRDPEPGHDLTNVLPLTKFIQLLKEEEENNLNLCFQVVNMGYLSIVGSHAVNGVAQLHSDLLKSTL
ncbi:MAG TPA: glycogen/starch/alpha-glucan phosphorylase, partial [Saprospiraceae bacterium]|nr:glycogen/starch/alpha-glucan phosphorylase [Saprospiraceae bacterium]